MNDNQDQFRCLRSVFYSQLKSQVDNILANLKIDGAPIASHAHTRPSHSQASRLIFTSLSLGIPFHHST